MEALAFPITLLAALAFVVGVSTKRIAWKILFCLAGPFIVSVIFFWQGVLQGGETSLGYTFLAVLTTLFGSIVSGIAVFVGSLVRRSPKNEDDEGT